MKLIPVALASLALGALIGASGVHLLVSDSLSDTPASGTPASDAPKAAPSGFDGRIAIALLPEERLHVRGEMLDFLRGVQALSDATLSEDRDTIRDVARSLRRGDGSGRSIRQKVPDGFREISRGLRGDFAAIADMADTADMPEIQRALSDSLNRCAACHGTYHAVTEMPDEPAQP